MKENIFVKVWGSIKKAGQYLLKIDKAAKWLFILIITVFVSSYCAFLIQTDFGNVKITTVDFPMRDGQNISADLYKPKTATHDNKAPLIIVIPGFQRTKETQSGIALEFARRGYVVINFDPYSQGNSSSAIGRESSAIASNEGYGAFDLIDYIYEGNVLNYIDKAKIGVTGHSAGGNAAYQTAVHFGKESISTGKPSKVNSVYISGYVISIDNSIVNSKSNMGLDYAYYDEGAFRNKPIANTGKPTSDMSWAIEAHDFVNSGLTNEEKIAYSQQIEIGNVYGNPNTKTMRQVFNTKTIHAFQPYDANANASMMAFFGIAMDYESNGLGARNLINLWKELFTTISLVAGFALLLPLATLLLKIPCFASVKQMVPKGISKRSKSGTLIFLLAFIVGAVVSAVSYIPCAQLTATFFNKATNSQMTWFFPQRMNNGVMLWAILNGVVSMVIFLGVFFTTHYIKKAKALKSGEEVEPLSVESWGVKITFKDILKTILVALMIVLFFYWLLDTVYYLFHVDYRFFFLIAAHPVNQKVILQGLMYIPFFLIFYLSNSIRVNGNMRVEGEKEWKSLLIVGLQNTLGLIIILAIQYITFGFTGTVFFTETPEMTQWLFINILFGLIPLMFVLPMFNRWFFKISGKSYLGPLVMCTIFILMMLANSVAYIPL
ncbi:MAG: dienelactone hydrolase family protein [Bacillales bacterium]|jgi:hypothetical protein|nr:dienelactone hydrolase family protein [Bacillales bacterium]